MEAPGRPKPDHQNKLVWRVALGALGIYLAYVVAVFIFVSTAATEMAGFGILLITLPAAYLFQLPRILIVGFVANSFLFFLVGAGIGWVAARNAAR